MVRYSTANQIQEQKRPKKNKSRTEKKMSIRRTNHKQIELSIFQNKTHVNHYNAKENTTSGQSDISTVESSSKVKITVTGNEMTRENLYHCGASCEIMEIIRRRNKIPETVGKERNAR